MTSKQLNDMKENANMLHWINMTMTMKSDEESCWAFGLMRQQGFVNKNRRVESSLYPVSMCKHGRSVQHIKLHADFFPGMCNPLLLGLLLWTKTS